MSKFFKRLHINLPASAGVDYVQGTPLKQTGTPLVEESNRSQTVNVIIFGEMGAGKSAVVNLIAQQKLAVTSSDASACTMKSTRHPVSFDGIDFSIFDTVGLNGPLFEGDAHIKAIESGFQLIQDLRDIGGIHLLLLCMRGGRIQSVIQSNYRLFFEFFCQKRVPIVLVVTGLERESVMEEWWTTNESRIRSFGLELDGHACITAVTSDSEDRQKKYKDSQQIIREQLKRHYLQTGAFKPDITSWVIMTGIGIKSLAKNATKKDGEKVEKALAKHLRLRIDAVKKIMEAMEGSPTTPSNQ